MGRALAVAGAGNTMASKTVSAQKRAGVLVGAMGVGWRTASLSRGLKSKGGFLGRSWGGGDPRSCLARTLGQGRRPTWPAECARGFRPQRGFFLSEISAHGVRCHQGFVTARAAPGLRGQKIWEALFL